MSVGVALVGLTLRGLWGSGPWSRSRLDAAAGAASVYWATQLSALTFPGVSLMDPAEARGAHGAAGGHRGCRPAREPRRLRAGGSAPGSHRRSRLRVPPAAQPATPWWPPRLTAAARLPLVRLWTLGAAAVGDLLTDLLDIAEHHAARTGTEASASQLLDAAGHHHRADALHRASARGLAEHHAMTSTGARVSAATAAARAAARLATVDHHRRAAASTLAATRRDPPRPAATSAA